MRILLADDQKRVRSGLKLQLAQIPGLQLAGEAADAAGLLSTIAQTEADLLLLDWELPGLPPQQLLRLIRYERPSLQIIVMSTHPEAQQAAVQAHVAAFLSKTEPPDRVLAIINKVLNGQGIPINPSDPD